MGNVNSLNEVNKSRPVVSLQGLKRAAYSYHLLMLEVNFENEDLMSCSGLCTVNLLLLASD